MFAPHVLEVYILFAEHAQTDQQLFDDGAFRDTS